METVIATPVVEALPAIANSNVELPPMDLLNGFIDRANRDTRKDSTRKSYDADVRAFEKWAESAGLSSPTGRPVPAEWVAAWAESMVNAGMAPATIERRVRGLGSHHRAAGYPDPTAFDKMTDFLRSVRSQSPAQKQAHALRAADVKAIAGKIDADTLAGARDKALVLLGFACALRVSELVAIAVEDIALSDDRVALTIRDAKTAKNNEVQVVVASCSPDTELCPVDAVADWLEMASIETGAAFRGITRHDTVRSSAISTRAVGDIIKARAKDAGVIGWADVSSHSLRRGWATEAAAQNVPQAIIKQHGRWKTDASAARYVDSAGSESALAATRAVIGGIRFAEAMSEV